MKKKIELLAPGGDIDSVKAAISAGADAVYCGINRFNARNRAANIDFKNLNKILNLAHKNNCQIFLTLNIIVVGSEIPALVHLLNQLINTSIDGVIVQDLGLFYLLSEYFKNLKIHASTQMTTHNEGQILFLNQLNATRVNLSRELSLNEIKTLASTALEKNMLTEIFVHGSQCISFSGICYLSSVHGGNSGNRGRCSQPCRDRYLTTPKGKNFPLNLKDNSAYFDLKKIILAGVASIKIEGRIKKSDYVYTVVNCWKKQIRKFYKKNRLDNDNSDLYKVFNRDFSNSYLKGDINKNMFIDNPRDNSIKQFSAMTGNGSDRQSANRKIKYYDEKEKINTMVKNKIKQLRISREPLWVSVSGKKAAPLTVHVKTIETSFIIESKTNLVKKKPKSSARCLDSNFFLENFKEVNKAEYYIEHIESENLANNLFIPFKEIVLIKKKITFVLNGSKKNIPPIEVPFLKKQQALKTKPALCVLISSKEDAFLCRKTPADLFFQLPSCFKNIDPQLTELFLKNKKLTPWFPPVLIGENFTLAVKFLNQIQPERVVTDNTGIAYEAYLKKIPWIAGPCLNIVNSFSLLCLQKKFDCSGSFISNEISKYQIKSIIKPENFKLYFSVYHPVLLLTSRQCLHHQTIGCKKKAMDEECLQNCSRSSEITNLKNDSLLIKKTKGNYHCIYNSINCLNTDIITDLPDFFTGFLIDLRDIKTSTQTGGDKLKLITLFENFLNGRPGSKEKLKQMIHPSINTQYKKGI